MSAESETRIRKLSEGTVNRIAAGEVVERPASAVKELVENALYAGATRIDIAASSGGADLIVVEDDGHGMKAPELRLAVERHATSKLSVADGEDDLSHIATLGFRGEALPSIGAVARLCIASRTRGSEAHEIRVEGGEVRGPAPCAFLAAGQSGTRVEVRDLFFATPARLKFLKSTRSEELAILDVVKRLAMARADVAFMLTLDGRRVLALEAEANLVDGRLRRLSAIMGRDFAGNAAPVEAQRENICIGGFAGLPTYNRATSAMQYLVVNGRPVRDRLLIGAVRGAYADYLARDRHPALALFLDCDPAFVDVNVHPAKTEVRFRDSGLVRGLIVSSLKSALHEAAHRTSTTVSSEALAALRPQTGPFHGMPHAPLTTGFSEDAREYHAPLFANGEQHIAAARVEPIDDPPTDHSPLGVARAQVHENYIVAQTESGIVIVDQHAAHERIVYERMKKGLANGGVARQPLLIPEVVSLDPAEVDRIAARAEEFAQLGLVVEPFGPDAVIVREMPALLGQIDVAALLRDLADELAERGSAASLKERLDHVAATLAC
ncbi:MAG: DNA mismatch repair endonuclease MutL, partial [Verrucomicrobia bacterium]|nr:DNA mismatch repair endonuclease MutL [Verrucomicrobiota bacterium]